MLNLEREKEGEGPLLMKDMGKILSSLASEDALKILHEARSGITSSTEAIKKLGLTQKRYYTRLKPLIEVGLVRKTEKGYELTVLGNLVYKISSSISDVLRNRDRLEVFDQLVESKALSFEEKTKIAKTLHLDSKGLSLGDLYGIRSVVKVIETYEELVRTVAECLDRARTEIRIASRYTVMELAEKVNSVVSRGVKIDWIDGDKTNLSSKLQILRFVIMNPKVMRDFVEAIHNPNNQMKFYSGLPFSFMIVDGKLGAAEVIHPLTNKFIFAIFFEDPDLCEKLSQLFNDLKEKAEEHPYAKLESPFKKLKL